MALVCLPPVADPADFQVSGMLVLSVAGGVFGLVSLVIQGLAKLAWKSREEVIRQGNDAAKQMADKAMSNTVDILKQLQAQEKESGRIDTSVRLLQADQLRAAKDMADVQSKMVTREFFEGEMRLQTATIKQTIEKSMRGEHNESTPPMRGPPRRPGE